MLPGTFGVFETFRILIPGYFAAVCATWYIRLFFPAVMGYMESTKLGGITFVAFGLAAGLVLYLSYLPRDSSKYREQQPSHYVYSRARALNKPIEMGDALEIYFYLLNNYFSDSMRERVFYYGNIYRVAQKTWLISISFLALAIMTQAYLCIMGIAISSPKGQIVYDVVLLVLFFLLRSRAEKHAMQILGGQIQWLKMRDNLVQSLITNPFDPNAKP